MNLRGPGRGRPRGDGGDDRGGERAGLDLVGVQDHPYQQRFFDTWTLLSYVAGRTEHVRPVPDVIDLGFVRRLGEDAAPGLRALAPAS